jgi:chemotaxis protein methyltransferase CheR
MTDGELSLFTKYVADLSGISLDASKRYLLESRLDDIMREQRCTTFSELYTRAKSTAGKPLERRIVDAISTNETFFFRDAKTFDLIKHKLVPDLLGDDLRRPIRIWSAACSTGQEAYSLTIALKEILFDLATSRVTILGTDISEAVVNTANRGEYTPLELGRGLDPKLQAKYFRAVGGGVHRVADELRGVCRFEVDNLLAPRTQGPFDIVLCRNVLIYFSGADKATVVKNLLARLKKTGFLLVGATESLLGVTDRVKRLEYHGATYYALAA